MPTYEYKCTVCENRFDVEQKITDDSLTSMPGCDDADDGTHRLKKVFSAVGIAFKGDGFYRNDSRSGARAASSSSSSEGNGSTSDSSNGDSSSGSSSSSSSSESSSGSSSSESSSSSSSSSGSSGGSETAKTSSTTTKSGD